MARPSSPVSVSTELAISDHMRWRLAVSAFLVWRSASSAAHGMCSTSLLSGFRPVFLAVASHIDVDETCPFAVYALGDPEFRRKQRAISVLIAATLWADDSTDPWRNGFYFAFQRANVVRASVNVHFHGLYSSC
jgi:hypothetical protein